MIRSGVGGCGIDSLDLTKNNPPENEQQSPGKGAMFKGNFIFNFQGDMLVSGRVIVEKVKVQEFAAKSVTAGGDWHTAWGMNPNDIISNWNAWCVEQPNWYVFRCHFCL